MLEALYTVPDFLEHSPVMSPSLMESGKSRVAIQKKKIGLSFGVKNGLRFHFDSVTSINYVPIFKLIISVGNLKPKLKWAFKLKLKPKKFLLN